MKTRLSRYLKAAIPGILILVTGSISCYAQKNSKEDKDLASRIKHFNELRTEALNKTPAQLHLDLISKDTVVYGIVFDWNTGSSDSVFSMIAYISGDSKIISTNKSSITVKDSLATREVAKSFVSCSRSCLKYADHAKTTPLPAGKESLKAKLIWFNVLNLQLKIAIHYL
jgi:hypothetical protein